MHNCFSCQRSEAETSFAKHRDGFHSYCKDCRKEYDRQRYLTRRDDEIERHKDKRARNQKKARSLLNELKSKPCLDCGRSFPPVCMDFDHRDPTTKLFDLAVAGSKGFSVQKILNEVAKCDVICAVCHRLRTQRFWSEIYPSIDNRE